MYAFAARPPRMDSPAQSRPLFTPDPGWLFLIAGVALCAATALVPAYDELAEAETSRDRARSAEKYELRRLANYSSYRDALASGEPTLALTLAATHLNLVPIDRRSIPLPGEKSQPDLLPFPALEPPPPAPISRAVPDTLLQRWTTDDRSRLWLLAAGAFCIFVGLLPATTPRRRDLPAIA
jgi:hypothetical protein